MSHDADHPGNGHEDDDFTKESAFSRIDVLESAFGEQADSLARLIGTQERFHEQLIKDVAAVVAKVLEERLVPFEHRLADLTSTVADLRATIAGLVLAVDRLGTR